MSDENRDHAGHLDFRVSENHIKPCIVLRAKCKVVSELGPFEFNFCKTLICCQYCKKIIVLLNLGEYCLIFTYSALTASLAKYEWYAMQVCMMIVKYPKFDQPSIESRRHHSLLWSRTGWHTEWQIHSKYYLKKSSIRWQVEWVLVSWMNSDRYSSSHKTFYQATYLCRWGKY